MDKIAWVAGSSKVLYGKTYKKYHSEMNSSSQNKEVAKISFLYMLAIMSE